MWLAEIWSTYARLSTPQAGAGYGGRAFWRDGPDPGRAYRPIE